MAELRAALPRRANKTATITVHCRTLAALPHASRSKPGVADRLRLPLSTADWQAVTAIEQMRPRPLRSYDQIPMRAEDLLRQAKLIAPALAGRSVAFVGDSDGASPLLGLLATLGGPRPARMLLLDFDERLLAAALDLAARHNLGHLLEVRRYNAFDPIPRELIGQYDTFYVNPPYGSRNEGASARLFITRGCELTHPTSGSGVIILPDDPQRPWTRRAMRSTLRFLDAHGWTVREKISGLHRYHLDDDRELASDLIVVERVTGEEAPPPPFAGRRVAFGEIEHFYGLGTPPPYPRYIDCDGRLDYDWRRLEGRR